MLCLFVCPVAALGKLAFKALELGAKYFSDVSSVLALFSTIYTIVNKCEDTEYGAEAKKYTEEAEKITQKINSGSNQINSIQQLSKLWF